MKLDHPVWLKVKIPHVDRAQPEPRYSEIQYSGSKFAKELLYLLHSNAHPSFNSIVCGHFSTVGLAAAWSRAGERCDRVVFPPKLLEREAGHAFSHLWNCEVQLSLRYRPLHAELNDMAKKSLTNGGNSKAPKGSSTSHGVSKKAVPAKVAPVATASERKAPSKAPSAPAAPVSSNGKAVKRKRVVEAQDGDAVASRPSAAPSFSDANQAWLKPKKRVRAKDASDSEQDDEEFTMADVADSDDEVDSGLTAGVHSGDFDASEDDSEDGSAAPSKRSEKTPHASKSKPGSGAAKKGAVVPAQLNDDDDEELPVEQQSRLLEQQRKKEAEDADAEMQMNIQSMETFVLPSGQQVEREKLAPPDVATVKQRITDVLFVLSDFSNNRKDNRPRSDYLDQLRDDMANYFGYLPELVEKFLLMFPAHECHEFLEANETPRPMTIRTNTLKTRRRDLAQALINRYVTIFAIMCYLKTDNSARLVTAVSRWRH